MRAICAHYLHQMPPIENPVKYGLEAKTDFRVCPPEDTLSIAGSYDAVFLKSVPYHIPEKSLYIKWLDWLYRILKVKDLLILVENGKGGILDRIYRRFLKGSRWADFVLYDSWVEEELARRFKLMDVKHYGRFSQFFLFSPALFRLIQAIETRLFPPSARHCFVASVVAQRGIKKAVSKAGVDPYAFEY